MPSTAQQVKQRTCKECKRKYTPWSSQSPLARFCGHECATQWGYRKALEKRAKAARAELRAKRQETKQIGYWYAETQRVFNGFIRERDHFKPCMTHGHECPNHGQWDAGHYKAVGMGGGASPLRFNCWNVHKQCSKTNRGAHKYSRYSKTPDQLNEAMLRERLGDERVDWLNGPHDSRQYTRDDLARIRRIFRKRTRLYEKLRHEGKRREQRLRA